MNHLPTAPTRQIGLSELLLSYRLTYRMLHQAQTAAAPGDKELISGMMSDVQYAIEWMKTGRCPANRRGIERRSACQREKLMDPQQMQTYLEQQSCPTRPNPLTGEQRVRLELALSLLSPRERECFELHHGMCYSLQEIASLLQLKKGTVQYYVQTAQSKLRPDKLQGLKRVPSVTAGR
ncbi:sigma-70 family RNA polymerase sigma factor [Paenibacillus piri]|uniref:Sigma-70 family RNA polymerase sigma factor n=1 Tax=Paenibacillus piri TaxID=2547395 RepID=A0A4R5KAM6_9BACL|nr:sigma-70 family RNA polymerase sigma factor [Paenibacillus piri]TDF92169.1 sigma-70 family RNA polymerase sigma factor [Paenibacillus piri]